MKATIVICGRRAYAIDGNEFRRCLIRVATGGKIESVLGMDLGTAYDFDEMTRLEALNLVEQKHWTDEGG